MANADRREFDAFYHSHVRAVFAYLQSRTDRARAIEALEETFVVAWHRYHDVPTAERAWLIGVARRILSHQRRAEGRQTALGLRIDAMRALDHVSDDPADAVVDRDEMLVALHQLSDSDRELLVLIAWAGLSLDESARVLDCTKATLVVRLHRARLRLESVLAATNESSGVVDPEPKTTQPFAPIQPIISEGTLP
jgi:RNA polymerase sigma-70 factor, ECF subfamily